MKNIVFIQASPKINEPAVSQMFLEMAMDKFDESVFNKEYINVRQSISRHTQNNAFELLSRADAIIMAFPLYFFCLPGMLMSFLQDYSKFHQENNLQNNKTRIYAIVNCGFPEPQINLEAVRVIESFSRHIGSDFRFGIQIGGGPMMLSPHVMKAPFLKSTAQSLDKAFSVIAADVADENQISEKYINIEFNFSRRIYFFMAEKGWTSLAKRNGLSKKELYKKPY